MILYICLLIFFGITDTFCISHYLKGEGMVFKLSVGGSITRFVPKSKTKSGHRAFLVAAIILLSLASLAALNEIIKLI